MPLQKMNFTNMKIGEFINNIIMYNNVSEIINCCNLQTEKGFIFERLFDIVIKFGFCDIFYGYLLFIHPSGWRNTDGKFKNIQKEILNRN